MSDMLTVEDLSKIFNMSKHNIYKRIKDGTLNIPHICVGSARRFLRQDVEDWINIKRKETGASFEHAL